MISNEYIDKVVATVMAMVIKASERLASSSSSTYQQLEMEWEKTINDAKDVLQKLEFMVKLSDKYADVIINAGEDHPDEDESKRLRIRESDDDSGDK